MRIPIHQVDAFASRVFEGNPAAVCPLERWLPAATMQAIAAENNLSETAFFVGSAGRYEIRWFTPVTEVDLCGHATLAAAHVLFEAEPRLEAIAFDSKSGPLAVGKRGDLIVLDFPARPATPWSASEPLVRALGGRPREVLRANDALVVYETEAEVRALRPDMDALRALEVPGVIATAAGTSVDFVSRYFAPKEGIPEDPVTGSAHCTLAPYWAKQLGKGRLRARQVSARGGELECDWSGGDRVLIGGRAIRYAEGTIELGSSGG